MLTGPGWSPDARVVRDGPLTWAQHEWVQWIPTDTDTSYEDNICAAVPGRDLPVGQVAAAIRDVLARHEGLRSLVRRGGREDSLQYVCPVDDRLDDVIQVMEDEVSFRRRFDTPWRRTCFRIGEQWPVKAVLDAAGGHVRRIDLVVDHVAIDPWGMRVLCDDLNHALRARAAGREPFGSGLAVEQPIDVALSETSPAGRAYQRRALGYWERRLGEIGKALDGHVPFAPSRAPLGRPGEPGRGEFRSCWLASRRAGHAAGAIARATGVSPSAAFLLAFGTAVCAVERSSRAGIFAISANRFSAGAGRSVRKATMTMPVLLPAVSTGSPGTAYRRALADCAAQQLSGHRFANADPYATERMCEEILGDLYRTGVAYPRFSYMDEGVADDLNTLWPAGDDGFPGDEDDRIVTFSPPRPLGARYMMTVLHRPAGAVFSLQWSDATGWGETAEDMLLYVEDLMVWAASECAGVPPAPGDTIPAP
ncbi:MULTISPECIES: hypothetical protein [unclassified Streptosporangium]|uniref:hypothetical protein n=1 Tax=unclassified Streptosporangium TaxID=2632669 RepID=UPI002E29F70D|nr:MULTISPECIES: hypothetical protein [unclassified Streptosporangium]